MNKSHSFIFALLALMCALPAQAAVEIGAPLSIDVKADMQAELVSSSTSGGLNVDVNGDGRVYKGDQTSETSTSADIDTTLAAEVSSDDNVTKVESDDSSVSLWYKVPARLFGFIPMGMNVRTTVDARGDVKVSHPWYYFLVSADDAGAEVAVQSKINATIGTSDMGVEGEAKLTNTTKAVFVRAIHGALKSTVGTNVSADAGASGN
ncbi:MAG: hypothetical protein KBC33_00920 [Candidatus Pacebacteria bacterium]|nr:hypothetical protein [Candidatus Paceibacterota bacterium]